jgi:hypothetical protein
MAAHLKIFYPLSLRAYAFLLRSGRKKGKDFQEEISHPNEPAYRQAGRGFDMTILFTRHFEPDLSFVVLCEILYLNG